ncbi:MAG: hypothetical protein ACFUZC_16115 [Chthoniobacteraceae bacterium]
MPHTDCGLFLLVLLLPSLFRIKKWRAMWQEYRSKRRRGHEQPQEVAAACEEHLRDAQNQDKDISAPPSARYESPDL